MKNLGMKIALNLALIALAIFVVVVKDVRLGKDLRGGVSLIYRVNMTEEEGDPRSRLAEVIRTLKERVNPTGVFDISMEPLGRDRIEVVMPLPGAEVQALQQEARRAMDALLSQAEIDAGTLDDSLRRGTAPAEVGGDTASPRGQLVAQLQSAFDQEKSARAALLRQALA